LPAILADPASGAIVTLTDKTAVTQPLQFYVAVSLQFTIHFPAASAGLEQTFTLA